MCSETFDKLRDLLKVENFFTFSPSVQSGGLDQINFYEIIRMIITLIHNLSEMKLKYGVNTDQNNLLLHFTQLEAMLKKTFVVSQNINSSFWDILESGNSLYDYLLSNAEHAS